MPPDAQMCGLRTADNDLRAALGQLIGRLRMTGCRLAAAEEALRGAVPSGANIYAVSDSPSQKHLSGMVEAQSVSSIFGDPTLPSPRRLHLEACRVPGAGGVAHR